MCDNDRVLISQRRLVAAVLVLLALSVPPAVRAQGVAALRVGARVAPACSVFVDSSAADVSTSPSVRVVCGRSALRALRVSADSGSGEDIAPVVGVAGRQQLSGGEVVFTVPSLVATLASRGLVSSLPRATQPATVVITLHF
jgi:hypothetical protein